MNSPAWEDAWVLGSRESPQNAVWKEEPCKYACVTSRDTERHFPAWRENNLCGCTLSFPNRSDKRRSILHLISRTRTAKTAVWKALHARSWLSLHSLPHSFQNMLWAMCQEEERRWGEMGRRGSYEYEQEKKKKQQKIKVWIPFQQKIQMWMWSEQLEVTYPGKAGCCTSISSLTSWMHSVPRVTEGSMHR